jgi:hypothetical protein
MVFRCHFMVRLALERSGMLVSNRESAPVKENWAGVFSVEHAYIPFSFEKQPYGGFTFPFSH